MKVRDKKWIRFRIYLVAGFYLAGLGTILARAYQLQILEKDHLESIARQGYIGTTKLPPKRGTIYDREGHELAVSIEVGSVYAHPNRIKDKNTTARSLSRVLGMPLDETRELIKGSQSFVWLARRIPTSRAEKVSALDLEGVGVTPETRRYYPCKEIAAHLIGFAGTDNQGLEGLEKRYDKFLRGPQHRLIHMRDALGRPFSISRPVAPDQGMQNLVLTIDKDIQYKAQQVLKSAVEKTKAKSGHCLVVDPNTGEILAMAVVPGFNPNIFDKYKPHEWRNRTITDCFEPGSTIKAFLLAACLEESVVSPETTFDCENGAFRVGRHLIHDTHEYGELSVSDIVVHSSNIGAIKVGARLGYERFCQYLRKFGFGSKTGINLLGERSGFIRPAKDTKPIGRATICFGQGATATSLQLAMAMSTIANGGKLLRPYVVKSMVDASRATIKKTYPKMLRRVISPGTAREVARILEGVTTDRGTAPQAAIPGYKAAGKTGTSQKVDPETKAYSRTKHVATFAGFVPVDGPRLVIVAVIDEPKGISYGGVVSGPVFREVGLWTLNHLRINPQIRLVDHVDSTAPGPVAKDPASEEIERIALELRVKAGLLPDFTGLGMREVLKQGRSLGLRVIPEGTGLAAEQDPSPGSPVQEMRVVKVRFRPPG